MNKKILLTITMLVALFVCLVSSALAWVLYQVDYDDVEIKFDNLDIEVEEKLNNTYVAISDIQIDNLIYIDESDISDTNSEWLNKVAIKYDVRIKTKSNEVNSDLCISIYGNTESDLDGLLMIICDSTTTLTSKLSELKTTVNSMTFIQKREECRNLHHQDVKTNISPNSTLEYSIYFIGFYPSLSESDLRSEVINKVYNATLSFKLTQNKGVN